MKKILITGANSYIGTSFENYIKTNYPADYEVDTVDMIDGSWKEKSFAGYDVVFHVAGIAHIKETEENAHLYYDINRDLPIEVAKKAKAEGVKQFIFLSSMSVYGKDTGVITKETMPSPKSNYGKSKIQAEEGLHELKGESFKIVVMRPPMVYGEGCKGNYNSIIKLVEKLPFFPKVNNKRSMIHIDNLSSFIKMAIDKELSGLYFPQNKEFANTTALAREIAGRMNKKVYMSFVLGFCVLCLKPFSKTVRKAFCDLIYKDTEVFEFSYCVRDDK